MLTRSSPARALPRLDERGVALPLALLGLVTVSLLVTAALVTSSTELAISGAHQDATRQLHETDAALQAYISERFQQPFQVNPMTYVRPESREYVTESGQAVNITAARLLRSFAAGANTGFEVFSFTAEPADGGRAVVSFLQIPVAVQSLETDIQAGMTTGANSVHISGSSEVSGKQDARLCAEGSDVKAVQMSTDATEVKIEKEQNIDGGLSEVEKLNVDRYALAERVLGGLTPRQMAQFADIQFGFNGKPLWSNNSTPSSDTYSWGHNLNWGCPRLMLEVYSGPLCAADGDQTKFPVVAIDAQGGSVKINQHHGQGMLIVFNGGLEITGKFYYSGVIIVEGGAFIRGSGGEARIDGAMISFGDVTLEDPTDPDTSGEEDVDVLGNAKIRYNSCMVTAAQQAYNEKAKNTPTQQLPTASTFAWSEIVR